MSVVWGLGLHAPVAQRVDGDAYARYIGCWSRLFVPTLLDAADVKDGDRVLDVARRVVAKKKAGNKVVARRKRLNLAGRPDREEPRGSWLIDGDVQGDAAGACRNSRRSTGHRQVDRLPGADRRSGP